MARANPIARNLGIYHQRVQSIVVRRTSVLAFVAALAPAVASGQAVQDFIIDPSPPAAPLEKAIGYFTSTTLPSVVLGSSSADGGPGGFYLYQSSGDLSGPWEEEHYRSEWRRLRARAPVSVSGRYLSWRDSIPRRSTRLVCQSAKPGRRSGPALVYDCDQSERRVS
jgi:hypothetical protein